MNTGCVSMKRLARKYTWWPSMDNDIEMVVKHCSPCQENAKGSKKEFGSWSWPLGSWHRIHLDFAGPYLGKMFLVMVDSFSKCLNVFPMLHATTESTISALRQEFAVHGLPLHIVTDNGTQFTSSEFQSFLSRNGIHHTCTAPSHPATNVLAERYVGHFKSKMKLKKLQRFLLTRWS